MLDRSALARLDRLGGPTLVREMIDLFLAHVPAKLGEARDARAAGDVGGIGRAAHALKSTAAHLGAHRVHALAERIERRALDGAFDEVVVLLDDLEREAGLAAARLAERVAEAPPRRTSDGKGAQPHRIAVVEDNEDNRTLVQAILADRYDITEYESGPDALAGMRADPPALVLLDISLPGMDGVHVLREIRADETLRHLPVIALTAHAMAGDRERFLAEGFDGYITKPIVDETLLLRAIEEHLHA